MTKLQSVFYLGAVLCFSCTSTSLKIKPAEESITEAVYASGIVKSSKQYEVFAAVNGLLSEVRVTEGDTVKKDDPLFLITNTNARLATENAALSADYAAQNNNTEKTAELKNAVDLASLQVDNTLLLFKRQQNLWAQQIGTRNDLDQRELAYKNAVNALETARLRYIQLQKQMRFQEKQSLKNVEIMHSTAGDYSVRSEVNGKVYSVLKKRGEMVNTQTPLAVLGDATEFELELQVDEYDIARIRQGQQIMVAMDSYKGQVFEAIVEKIDPLMNERLKSFTVKAKFIQPPATLYPNLSCEANIIIRKKEKALTIPRSCLIDEHYVLMANKEKRPVITGLKDYQKVEVTSGLTSSDLILKPIP